MESGDCQQVYSTPAKAKPKATAPPPEGGKEVKEEANDEVDLPINPRRVSWAGRTPMTLTDIGQETLDEFHQMPSLRGVVEWIVCLFFDCFLLVVEVGISLWLASDLFEEDLLSSSRSILICLVLPCIFNPLVWLALRSTYQDLKTPFILALVLLGFPSPLFVYIWHLYLSMFARKSEALKSKHLANTFRIVQAFTCSIPILLINIVTLINVLRVPGREHLEVDADRLTDHLFKVEMHGIAFFISLFNLVRAASLFNERQTYTLLFVLVSFPFVLLTVMTRIMALGIISAFLMPEWTAILLLGLTFVNIVLYLTCRKGRIVYAPMSDKGKEADKYLKPVGDSDEFEMENSECTPCTGCTSDEEATCSCCSMRNRNYTYTIEKDKVSMTSDPLIIQERTFIGVTLKTIMLSMLSIVVPSSYSNDARCHHPRLKGGLFILLNYITTVAILGSTLGYTIIHYVPNVIKGVVLPQPSVKVQLPGSKIMVNAMGLDLALDLPQTNMDLGSMPQMSATINTAANDYSMAIAAPMILALVVFPFVVMRAAMMELDCFITRRKLLNYVDLQAHDHRKKPQPSSTLGGQTVTLIDTIARSANSKEMKTRMYLTLCCGMLGMIIMVFVFMILGAFIVLNIH